MLFAFIGLVPVVLFLSLLLALDSFKLVKGSAIAAAIGWGAAAALIALPITHGVDAALHLSRSSLVRYVGPVIEETLKLLLIALLLRRKRIGFPVDAAVLGFAIGTGFALVENTVYLRALANSGLTLWFVRGLGTAILHGGTSSIAAMVAKMQMDRAPGRLLRALASGWIAAVVLHSAYNHLLLPPVASTLLLLVVFPLLILAVFQRSEAATREWVGAGLDLDVELLDLIGSEHFRTTRFGTFLEQLRDRFPAAVVLDMFCMLRLELELSVQAKALLLAREAGLKMAPHPDVAAGLAELQHLRSSIGPTGMLALTPMHVTSDRDEWHRYLVAETGTGQWFGRRKKPPRA
jgi:protease PrsW